MNNKKLNIALIVIVVFLGGILIYQNFIAGDDHAHEMTETEDGEQLWTCGMHPDIVVDEPGNCPICGMKLTPVKKDKSADGKREILYWVAPMDPNEIYEEPGKSKMGMDLVPVYSDEASQAGVVNIDPSVQQNMNVKFTKVEEGRLNPSIETNGIIAVDERKEIQITSRVSGWIEKLYVNYTGQKVAKGEKLLEIYSPDLVSAQQEYLTALKYQQKVAESSISSSGDQLINNAYRKLQLLNLSPKAILELENSGEVKTTVPLYSPVNGTVLMKNIVEGEKIKPEENLLHIADLSNLWIKADIYESDISNVSKGQTALVRVDAFPDREFEAKVSFVYPTIDPKTRTTQVRIDIDNRNGKLKPAMLADVTIMADELKPMPLIPETAVIRSGQQEVAVQFMGDGNFKPVALELGKYADGKYQVLSGLKPGDVVVTSAQFLIDSESSLKTAMKNFGKAKNEDMNMEDESMVDSPLIRKGKIDVEAIDENNDGMVYQDPMDWNVISDEPGKCPICEMNLVEVTIDEAKQNLLNNGFEVKGEEPMMEDEMQNYEMEHDHSQMENEYGVDSPLIRTGKIDLSEIDKNSDGKLFECPMDWNVIADEYQRCPVCEMKMKEYTIEEVKSNLDEHGYEYK